MTSGRGRGAIGLVRANGLVLSAALVMAMFAAVVLLTDVGAFLAALSSFDPTTFGIIVALVTVSYGIRFCKWEYYLRTTGVDVQLGASLLTFFSGLMMVVTPGKLGEAWKAWFLRDVEGVPVDRTVAVVGAERATDLMALTALASLGLLVHQRSPAVLAALAGSFAVGVAVLQTRSVCLAALDRCRGLPVVGPRVEPLRRFYETSFDLFRLRPLAVALATSVIAWGLEGLGLWLALRALGTAATPLVGVSVFGFGTVLGAVSLLPGGLAAAEAGIVGALVGLGYGRPIAVTAAIVIRAATLWYGAVLGTAVFGSYRLHTRLHDTSPAR